MPIRIRLSVSEVATSVGAPVGALVGVPVEPKFYLCK